MSITWHVVPPNSKRIVGSLRDTGYEFDMAAADLVDNSIAAGATTVLVDLDMTLLGEVRFTVADNGSGMDEAGLLNALKYGSDERADAASLGKFGMGLNTASTAFAQRVLVTSRDDASAAPLTAILDLTEVEREWPVGIEVNPSDLDLRLLEAAAANGSGTVVRWDIVDRLQKDYKDPGGAAARKALDRLREDLRDHLQMVFQRYLDHGDGRAANVDIFLNGSQLFAWDPFAEGLAGDLVLSEEVSVEISRGEHVPMLVRAFIMPRKDELDPSVKSQVNVSNELQGIYVYREGRLIHSPSWLGMWGKEPHVSLLRVELSFDHRLDRAFDVDIKKSRILLNPQLRNFLRDELLRGPRQEAIKRYRKGQSTVGRSEAAANLHDTSNHSIADKSGTIDQPVLESVNEAEGTAQIRNQFGSTEVKQVAPRVPGRVFVESAESIEDGLLYEPAYIGQNLGVRINQAHPYYAKVYLPNRNSSVTIQGLDSLLWALASAEYRSTSDSTRQLFEHIRFDVSMALRKLVEDLPDPEPTDGSEED
ncbi:MAG: hypothetical protein BGO97_09670 [Micrococcales bacterium 70-64]|nr:ATP-binding protein [Leifsonia sp.]ODU64270.1 MAG: hypothetical protein ABT06_09675 [Leifsonia sp. SCN 70-46]OJX85961.1 MAG: hypothetical protein BGO97_09670 [Micrococcales bacterium 70-64]